MTSPIPVEMHTALQPLVGRIIACNSVAGGSINKAAKIETTTGAYFVKWNNALSHPHMFEQESHGLDYLAATRQVRVPQVFGTLESGDFAGLLMEWIETCRGTSLLWEKIGYSLAEMHRLEADYFGLDHDNYMGSLSQAGGSFASFPTFFITQRLKPQVELAISGGYVSHDLRTGFLCAYRRVEELFGGEKPCLVHGDLWSGNLIFDAERPYLIDPAIAYSSRLVDLSMTTMFGVFPDEFYQAYRTAYPWDNSLKMHWDLLKLYPLLIHLNIFGRSYLPEIQRILSVYSD